MYLVVCVIICESGHVLVNSRWRGWLNLVRLISLSR